MLKDLSKVTMGDLWVFIQEWYTATSKLFFGAVIVGYICYKIFGP